MKISKTCIFCGKKEEHEVPQAGYEAWQSGVRIQDAMPDVDVFTREFLISSLCFDCISKTFNKPKPGEDWGEMLGECECCGAPIYAKDLGICSKCGEPLGGDDGECEM